LIFDVIALDADDTLWHNESLYVEAQAKLIELLSSYVDGEMVTESLYEREVSNLDCYGFGIKGFTLSMIETAIELSGGRIPGADIQKIIGLAREMLTAEVQLVAHAEKAITELAHSYTLMLITKGDLLEQLSKVARSGIRDHFRYVEVVSEKTEKTYEALLTKYEIEPGRFLMAGNSLKSDILPVVALGGHAVYIPHESTWAYETVDGHQGEHDGYYELEHLGQLPQLLARLSCGR